MNINVSEIPNFSSLSFCVQIDILPKLPSEKREFCSNNNYTCIHPAKASIERIQYLYSNLIICVLWSWCLLFGFLLFFQCTFPCDLVWISAPPKYLTQPYFVFFGGKSMDILVQKKRRKKKMVNFFLFVCKVEDRVPTQKWYVFMYRKMISIKE